MLECYTALAFVAALQRDQAGDDGHRHHLPSSRRAGEAVTTLDVLSGGRAYLGMGAAWCEREHLGLGVPFPPVKERFERLEERCGWPAGCGRTTRAPSRDALPARRDVERTQAGHHHIRHPDRRAAANRRHSGRRQVRRCHEHLRRLRMTPASPRLRHKLDVLRAHCEREGRSYNDIEKTTLHTLWMTPDPHGDRWLEPEQAIERLGQLREAGVDHAIFQHPERRASGDPANACRDRDPCGQEALADDNLAVRAVDRDGEQARGALGCADIERRPREPVGHRLWAAAGLDPCDRARPSGSAASSYAFRRLASDGASC